MRMPARCVYLLSSSNVMSEQNRPDAKSVELTVAREPHRLGREFVSGTSSRTLEAERNPADAKDIEISVDKSHT
jgi:hypothetical protein